MNSREIASEFKLAQWAQALKERAASGESVKEFCRGKGVSRNTFFYWQRKVRDAACGRLAEAQGKAVLPAPGFVEVRQASPAFTETAAAGRVCVEAGAFRITADSGYPAGMLAELLREAARQC